MKNNTRYSINKNDKYSFTFYGTSLDYSVVAKDDTGKCMSTIFSLGEDGTESLKNVMSLDWNNDGSKTDYPTYWIYRFEI